MSANDRVNHKIAVVCNDELDETQAGSLHPGPVEPVGVTFTGLAANAFAAVTFAGAGAAATYATYGVVSTVVQTAG